MKISPILLIGAALIFMAKNTSAATATGTPANPLPVTAPDIPANNQQAFSIVYGVPTPLTTDITRAINNTVVTYTAPVPAYTGTASYDPISGTGYSSSGAGYSSAFNMGSSGTGSSSSSSSSNTLSSYNAPGVSIVTHGSAFVDSSGVIHLN